MALNRYVLLVISAVIGTAASGCHDELELTGETSQELCMGTDCPGNSANIKGMPIDDLHLGGLENAGRFKFLHVRRYNGAVMRLDMSDGILFGVDTTQNPPARYALVTNDELVVLHVPSQIQYRLRILGKTRSMQAWWDTTQIITAYHLGYIDPEVPSTVPIYNPICTDPPVDDPAWTGLETYAVFFKGERYDEASKTVYQTGIKAAGWFNIACAGTAVMKMFRMGYNPELPAEHPRYSTPTQRQATLKMITADYCGTGKSFTETGEEIVWHNAPAWAPNLKPGSPNLPAPVSSEAVWTADGVLCLDTVRRAEHYPNPQELQALYDKIGNECGQLPPACSTLDLTTWTQYAEWRTYNP